MLDFSQGFILERPSLVIPWHVTEDRLVEIVGSHSLNHVVRSYYTTTCIALGGLPLGVGFHFGPWWKRRLREFEVWRPVMVSQDSFAELQAHVERAIGPPTSRQENDSGFPRYDWRRPKFRVAHFVRQRFGPEEHLRFVRR